MRAETSIRFPTDGQDVYVVELENPIDYLENRGYLQDIESVENVAGFVFFIDRGSEDGNAHSEDPIRFLAIVAKRFDDPLPSVLLAAGDGVVGFDLSENRAVVLRPDSQGGVSAQFDVGDAARLGSCFLGFLGVSGFDDIGDLIGNFCQLTGQTREAVEIAAGLSSCVDLTILPSNLGCYLYLALTARFVGCGINDIVQCIEGDSGADFCTTGIPLNTTVREAWSSNCSSSHRSGRYARYFSFSLSAPATVQIDLRSSADTYLFLLQGTGSGGTVVASDDDGGRGQLANQANASRGQLHRGSSYRA